MVSAELEDSPGHACSFRLSVLFVDQCGCIHACMHACMCRSWLP
jgi:hypothetical protein